MNTLTKADVLVQNQLFATLDTTTRKLDINTGMPILISDTVGFIRNLPHNLIASFRSTLGEIRDVDMLIKVFDASSDNIHEHITTVEKVLTDINIQDKANIVVMNKIDLINDSQQLEGLKIRFKNSAFISCYNKAGITTLLKTLQDTIRSKYYNHVFHLTYKQTNLLDKIYTSTKVLKKISDYNGIKLEVEGSRESIDKIRQILEN